MLRGAYKQYVVHAALLIQCLSIRAVLQCWADPPCPFCTIMSAQSTEVNRSLALRCLLPLSWKCTHVCCNEVHPHYLSDIIIMRYLHRALAAAEQPAPHHSSPKGKHQVQLGVPSKQPLELRASPRPQVAIKPRRGQPKTSSRVLQHHVTDLHGCQGPPAPAQRRMHHSICLGPGSRRCSLNISGGCGGH